MWKDFFYYSRSERRVILLLLGLLVILATFWMICRITDPPEQTYQEDSAEIDSFLASVKQRKLDCTKRRYTKVRGKDQLEAVLSSFDPNTADSFQLRKLGLSPFVVRNILRYREKGGRFRTPEAFAKIYGLEEKQFLLLKPYIRIQEVEDRSALPQVQEEKFFSESVQRIEKYPEGTLVSLNEADTTELKRVPGIGSGIARMIVAYRNRLGGFTQVEQLQEIPHVDVALNQWFVVEGAPFRKIRVNKDGLDKLRNHPYMDFYKAKVILEYRRKQGNIKGLSRLSLFEEFSEKDLQRLSPYLSFE